VGSTKMGGKVNMTTAPGSNDEGGKAKRSYVPGLFPSMMEKHAAGRYTNQPRKGQGSTIRKVETNVNRRRKRQSTNDGKKQKKTRQWGKEGRKHLQNPKGKRGKSENQNFGLYHGKEFI